MEKAHKRICHFTRNSLIKRLRDQEFRTKLSLQVKLKLISISYNCSSHIKCAELPRTSQLGLPTSPDLNIAVRLDVLHYDNKKNSLIKVIVMLDVGDEMLRIHQLHDESATKAFQA